jgi:hypothetical protein
LGNDEEYNIYDKPLFTTGTQAALFKAPAAGTEDAEGERERCEMRCEMRFEMRDENSDVG